MRGEYSRVETAALIDRMKTSTPPGGINPQGGKVYFVNKDVGNNSNAGTDPDAPLADLEAAYLKCDANKGDYIFVQRAWALTAAPLTIAKKRIHIIGLDHNPVGYWHGQAMIGDAAVSVVFDGESHEVELAGFCLGSPDAGQPAVQILTPISGGHIHHCAIGQAGSGATYGIYGGEMDDGWTIDHCEFGTGLTESHIAGIVLCTVRIANNVFRNPAAGKECLPMVGATDVEVFGNMFFSPAALALGAGWAVHLTGGTANSFIYNNWAAGSGSGSAEAGNPGNNPYRDETGADVDNTLNGWAGNYDANTLVTPDH